MKNTLIILLLLFNTLISFSSFASTPLTCKNNAKGSFFGTLTAPDLSFPVYIRYLDIFVDPPLPAHPYGAYMGILYKHPNLVSSSAILDVKCTENSDGSLTVLLRQPSGYLLAKMFADQPTKWQITESQYPLQDGVPHHFTGTLTSWDAAK